MAGYHYPQLNPHRALVWRIIHRDNLPWVLDNGVHCGNSSAKAPAWITIGNPELIDKRAHHPVPIFPGGYLNDYVPFYFTPFSVMMRNIHTGWGGIKQRKNEEIVILVSSIPQLQKINIPYIFTDSHAYYQWANFYSNPADLDKVDWPLLQSRDFRRAPDDPAKFERYQAETLVHGHLPVTALVGIVCYTEALKNAIEAELQARNLNLSVRVRTGWYF